MLGFLVLTLGACTAQVGREAAGQGGAGPGSGGSGAAASGGSGNAQSVGGSSGSAGSSTGGGGSSSGGSGGSGKGGSGGSGNAGGVPPVPDDCDPSELTSETPLRRLGRLEYLETLRDLLAPANLDGAVDTISSFTDQLPPDGENRHLYSRMDRRLTQRHVDAFYGIADALAKRITEDQAALEALVGDCAGDAEPTTACAGDFVRSFGARVFRRPRTDAEVERYLELRTAGTASSEVFFGILFTLLLSPEMLYHLEIGGDPTADEPRLLALSPC
jgi:hypothetical protein